MKEDIEAQIKAWIQTPKDIEAEYNRVDSSDQWRQKQADEWILRSKEWAKSAGLVLAEVGDVISSTTFVPWTWTHPLPGGSNPSEYWSSYDLQGDLQKKRSHDREGTVRFKVVKAEWIIGHDGNQAAYPTWSVIAKSEDGKITLDFGQTPQPYGGWCFQPFFHFRS